MTHVSIQPGVPVWLVLVAAVASAAGIAFFYWRAFSAVPLGAWLRLYGLRMAAVGIVLILLLRPVLTQRGLVQETRTVMFLIDRSASMAIRDEPAGATRWQQGVDRVRHWQTVLEPHFRTQAAAFTDQLEPLAAESSLAAVQPTGEATSLVRALDAATQLEAARNLEAIVLVSDGIHNSAGDPQAMAARLGVPVHTAGAGQAVRDRSAYRDMRVTEIDLPDQLSLQNRVRVQGGVDAVGFSGRVVTVELLEDDAVVAQQEIVLDDQEGSQPITFEFTPTRKGLHKYTVRIPPAPEERIPENNERSDTSLVIEARIRVLYIEGTLRAEYGAVVGHFLSRDPDLEYCALVQTRPNVFLRRSNMPDLDLDAIPTTSSDWDRFDVLIFGDLDATYLPATSGELIRERVRAGAGLLVVGGYHSLGPGGYQGTPIEEVLPVLVGDREIGQIGESFQPQLTLSGRQHPIFGNIAPFFPTENGPPEIASLPELAGCVRVAGAKPGATVLAVHPTEQVADGAPLPVMALAPFGAGRAAVFTGDTTRNWHQVLRSQDRETPFLRFWGQTVRWLAGRQEDLSTEAGVVASTDKVNYEPGANVTITAVVRGEQGAATSDAVVTARVKRSDNAVQQVRLAPIAGPAGNYQAVFQPEGSGRFEVRVDAQFQDRELAAEPLAIEVGRPNLEFDRLDLDEAGLIGIAAASGGRYAPLRSADRLIEQLERSRRSREVEFEIRLYWPTLLWCAFVGVLTSEWLLRRRYALR